MASALGSESPFTGVVERLWDEQPHKAAEGIGGPPPRTEAAAPIAVPP